MKKSVEELTAMLGSIKVAPVDIVIEGTTSEIDLDLLKELWSTKSFEELRELMFPEATEITWQTSRTELAAKFAMLFTNMADRFPYSKPIFMRWVSKEEKFIANPPKGWVTKDLTWLLDRTRSSIVAREKRITANGLSEIALCKPKWDYKLDKILVDNWGTIRGTQMRTKLGITPSVKEMAVRYGVLHSHLYLTEGKTDNFNREPFISGNLWSEEEIAYIQKGGKTAEALAIELGRSVTGIKSRLNKS